MQHCHDLMLYDNSDHHNVLLIRQDDNINWRRTSAPASLAASRENLLDKSSRSSTPSIELYKRYSADLSKLTDTNFLVEGVAAVSNAAKPPGQ